MKVEIALLIFAAVATAKTVDKKYSTKYDNIDIYQILNNTRLYKNYFECIMDRGTCTTDGKELRKNMPDAIATDCEKCSDTQKKNTAKVLQFMLENKKDDYAELEAKYDPTGSYRKRHNITVS